MSITIDGTNGITFPNATTQSGGVSSPATVTQGGTGLTSLTSGGAMYATSTSALTTGTLPVTAGGTGNASATAYAVQCGGTTSTGALQSIASVGTSGQVLTSNGAGALPTFQAAPGGFTAMQTFTASGTFTVPAGKTTVKVTVVGGGGAGYNGLGCCGSFPGTAGGTSSFGAYCSATGGGASPTAGSNGAGGTGSSGDLNITGGTGLANTYKASTIFGNGGYGSGGRGAGSNGGTGGAGGAAIKYITGLTPASTVSVTVGSAGNANGQSTGAVAGVVTVEY